MSKRRLEEFDTLKDLNKALAEKIHQDLSDSISAHGRASLAVSGGSTPKGLFDCLAEMPLEWRKVTVTLVDDRWVANDHNDSNEALVRNHLLQEEARKARFIPLKLDYETPAEAVRELHDHLETIETFTCVILGMGADGHTASFFPKSSSLADCLDKDNIANCSYAEPSDDEAEIEKLHPRITLTLSKILKSENIYLQISSKKKLLVYHQALAGGKDYPVEAVLKQNDVPVTTYWAAK